MPSINPFDLSGRVAVVTGGNGGIGCRIALGTRCILTTEEAVKAMKYGQR
jgi:NAD(P)-dependent dehydrogenase (short-subunit alcohol dehydrogenase family)